MKIRLLAQNCVSETLDAAVMVWKQSFFSSREDTNSAAGVFLFWEKKEGKGNTNKRASSLRGGGQAVL